MKFRLIWAIISIIIEEIAIIVIALTILPKFDIKIPPAIIVLLMAAWLIMSVLLYRVGSRALDKKPSGGLDAIIGKKGIVVRELNPKGQIKISGELWSAESEDYIGNDEEIIVTGYTGIKLTVKRFDINDANNNETH